MKKLLNKNGDIRKGTGNYISDYTQTYGSLTKPERELIGQELGKILASLPSGAEHCRYEFRRLALKRTEIAPVSKPRQGVLALL